MPLNLCLRPGLSRRPQVGIQVSLEDGSGVILQMYAGRSDQAVLVGVDHQLHAVAQVQLGQDPRYVRLDGRLREELLLGDLREIGRASCRERVYIWEVAGAGKEKRERRVRKERHTT